MIVFRKIFQSSIGRKTLMAVTGAALILFLFAHLSGNLLMFAGQDAMNNYAVSLREMGPLLWIARIGLLTIFVIHIGIGISLSIQNRRARPERYQYEKTIQASVASRFMIQTGLLLLFYLLYHLAHFTLGLAHEQYFHLVDTSGRHDVYSMVVLGFRQWYISLIYI
ncbi:MAG: succinate:quinone oxidoreductase, partial [Leptospiraceae bacterium]|nr:succinate:quinone oxidoreductase [Leptospiraceae bacterium]